MIKTILASIAMTGMLGIAQEKIPVQMTVTVEGTHGQSAPDLKREDVMVFQGKQRLPVTEWTPLTGDQAGLEMFILIDDASATSLGMQLADLRDFINSQPSSALIGVGYIRYDVADIVQNLTTDHVKAANALRLPFGWSAVGASPYLALTDLLRKWPTCCVRREVVLVSSGVDPLGGIGPSNPYVDVAIEHAQRAGVVVYSLYAPRAGHAGHSVFQMNWGQNYLGQVSDETGGESYMLGFGPPVSFAPYLREVAEHLKHQYSVTFLASARARPGMVPVRITTEVPNAEIIAAPKFYLELAPPTGEDRQ